jgi:hypothetical protein
MDIEGLMKYISDEQKTLVRDLIKLKATVGEKYLHPQQDHLESLAVELFEYAEVNKAGLQVNRTDMRPLDQFFLKMLNENAHY